MRISTLPLVAMGALALLTPMASGTVLLVDNSDPGAEHQTINSALLAAAHGDTILVRYGAGTYSEHVLISAKVDQWNDPYHLVLLGEAHLDGSPPRIQKSYSGQDRRRGVVEIHNDNRWADSCIDMRVTFSGFEVVGEHRAAALTVRHADSDPGQDYFTGLFIRNNILRSEKNLYATVQLGHKNNDVNLFRQSVKWGEITNNIIIMQNGYFADGITSHHFVGTFSNNRITSTSEGIHLGLGTLDDRHGEGDPPFDNSYFETLIEHNLIYKNPREGIHFTHGSAGIIRNNIIIGREWEGNSGIFVGQTLIGTAWCSGDSDEGMTDSLAELIGEVDVEILNNTIDRTVKGVMVDKDATLRIHNNIITRTKGANGTRSHAFCTFSGTRPSDLTKGYNFFSGNQSDYDPPCLESITDVHADLGDDNHPRYQGWQDPAHKQYSYMLQTNNTSERIFCYPAGPHLSAAIDAGAPIAEYNDQQPPGLNSLRNDMGAFGGPHAVWDPSGVDACLEYTNLFN